MAVNNIISAIANAARDAFRGAVSMTKAWLQTKSLNLGALAGVSLGGNANFNSISTPQTLTGPIRGGPGQGRG